jgi:isoleucyl-tRNA synthetase
MAADPRHPLIPTRAVDARQELPALEQRVLERWRERDVFAESLRRREGAKPWVFYEGPPTANGRPGSHHVLSRVFKDIYPRYRTMRGYRVERKGGWDCHGLPVEIAVERELDLKSKADIERYGIREFNAKCRESVFEYLQEWDRLTERIGFWVDLEGAYRTLDESYIESVWWALAEIHRKGLLYEGHKVVPYCPRCGTALSSHEVALGYEDVVDPSVYVRLPVGGRAGPLQEGDALLIWTTTPWTLPGNVAVAVGPEIEYVRARLGDEILVLAAARVEPVLGKEAEIVDAFAGSELIGERVGGRGEGAHYSSPIFPTSGRSPGGAPVIAGDFVTTDDGTGIVHIAPAFGEDDFRAAAAAKLGAIDPDNPHTVFNPVRDDGTYGMDIRGHDGQSFEGRFVKDPDRDPTLADDLIADLEARGLLFKREDYEHSYPHCWRCGTPLIYYAKLSWYIATSKLRERMLDANETVAWHPPHIKHGRFGDWLQNNVDWAISRERYWGTPLPVWRCSHGHVRVIGSFAELERLSGVALKDHHRPDVDEVELPCEDTTGCSSLNGTTVRIGREGEPCDAPMRRVAEVIDVWFDSGAMPFAQHHAPFDEMECQDGAENAEPPGKAPDPADLEGGHLGAAAERFTADAERFTTDAERFTADAERFTEDAERFPADFICEALDQTRGWFYSLLAVSTLLFDRAPYRNVVCLGLILDAEGQKMSKSRGNTVEPWQVLDAYGADAFRWYFFTSKQPWDGYRFSQEAIGEGVRLFLKQLWSTYFFYVLYAHANRGALEGGEGAALAGGLDGCRKVAPGRSGSQQTGWGADGDGHARDLDRWALSRTASTALEVAERLDAYDATSAGRAIAQLVDELSNWYVRRSRRRFWDGEQAAFATLRECLLIVAKLLAPFCPFMADEVYDNLDGTLASVHLCEFPSGESLPERDADLEETMTTARETVRLGLGARAQAKIKVRQPLAEAVVVADGRERAAIERMADVVREELNVRRVRFVEGADELGEYDCKPNYRALGPLFGKDMPLVAQAIAALDGAQVATAVRNGGRIGVSVGGREHTLSADDVLLSMRAPEGYSVEREGAHAVALDLKIDDDLLLEGRAREIVHAVQNARKTAGLDVEDRIELILSGAPELLEAARAHADYVAAETLALSLTVGSGEARTMDYVGRAEIDGLPLEIALSRVERP